MKGKHFFQSIVAIFIILIVPVLVLTNVAYFKNRDDQLSTAFIDKEDNLNDKSFVFIIYANTNVKNCEQNINSILNQNYDKYRIIFLETQNVKNQTNDLRQLVAKHNKLHFFSIISCEAQLPTVENFKSAIDLCNDDEIVVQMESNDWLAHENVLLKLNEVYSGASDVWLTYGQCLIYPSYRKGDEQPYMKQMLRNRNKQDVPWVSSRFKTYYAGLFKQIKSDVFNYNQALINANLDLYTVSMAQISKNHIYFIDDILYIHCDIVKF